MSQNRDSLLRNKLEIDSKKLQLNSLYFYISADAAVKPRSKLK